MIPRGSSPFLAVNCFLAPTPHPTPKINPSAHLPQLNPSSSPNTPTPAKPQTPPITTKLNPQYMDAVKANLGQVTLPPNLQLTTNAPSSPKTRNKS